jgi:hypothetical protein
MRGYGPTEVGPLLICQAHAALSLDRALGGAIGYIGPVRGRMISRGGCGATAQDDIMQKIRPTLFLRRVFLRREGGRLCL